MFKMKKRAIGASAATGGTDDGSGRMTDVRGGRSLRGRARGAGDDASGEEDDETVMGSEDAGSEDEDGEDDEDASSGDEDFQPARRRRVGMRDRGASVASKVANDAPAVDPSEFSIDADRKRFKVGTLKHEVFQMLEEAWPEMLDAAELYARGEAAGKNVGKNKTVLASGLSHDPCFVRVPGTRNKWALRAHVGLPSGVKRKAEDDKEPRVRKAAKKPSVSAMLEALDPDQRASLAAWTDKLKRCSADLKKSKQTSERAAAQLEKCTRALEEFETNPPMELAAPHLQNKSNEDILCEPDAPQDRLAKKFLEFDGAKEDRKGLMTWKKSVEDAKAEIKKERDAYVVMRKKEIREAMNKMNKMRETLTINVRKAQSAAEQATGNVERAEEINEITKQRVQLMKDKAAATDDAVIQDLDEKINAMDAQLTELFGQKLVSLENQIEREKLKLMAKGEREAERARIMSEKNRLKEQEKAEKAAMREREKQERDALKAAEKVRKEKEARYPIDDDMLAIELAEEAKEAGVPFDFLYHTIPKPVSLPNGQILAEEASIAEFLSTFAEGLEAPPGLNNADAVNDLFENNTKARSTLAELYLSLLYEALTPAASGPGRLVARLNRIVNNLNWPEVARTLILHGGEKIHGKGAYDVAEKLGKVAWVTLSKEEHLVLLRALADTALEGDVCRGIISARMQQADVFRTERHEARLKAAANRRIVEKAEKEERRIERERLAEEKRKAKAEAEAAKAATEAPTEGGASKDEVKMDTDEEMKNEEEADEEERKFELPDHLKTYTGHPEDRHALMAWKNEVARAQAVLNAERNEYEQERAKIERAKAREENEGKRKIEAVEEAARRRLEIDESRARQREIKRAAEDAQCQVRCRPLGMDRHLATYWWGFGGRQDAVYVQSFSGEWGIYNTQQAVDALVKALCPKGVRERALLQQLEKRKVTIADAFKALSETQEDRDRQLAAALDGRPRRSAMARSAPSMEAYVATRPAAFLSCDEGAVLTFARKCMDTMCINAERIGIRTTPDWRTFRNKLKNVDTTFMAESLLQLEEKYYHCQIDEFRIAAEVEKIEREKQPQAPDELSKATLEALVLKHTGKDMASWKLARRKLAALLPAQVIQEAVEERRRQQVDSDEEEEEEDDNAIVDESWNNDENAPDELTDISVWKGSLQRPQWIASLSTDNVSAVRIAYAAATLLDATSPFTEEIVHRHDIRDGKFVETAA